MNIEDNLKDLIEKKSGSLRAFAADNDIPYTTLRSILERGVLNSKMDNIIKICKGLGISPEDLAGIEKEEKVVPMLSQQDDTMTSYYNYFDAGLSAGVLNDVDPFMANDVKTIGLSDVVMGKYAGDKDIFITYINGESMNRIIPDGSLIAIKKYSSFSELCNGDIVAFQEGAGMAVKRFYNDADNKIITFTPDSSNIEFHPINYLYDSMSDVKIIGKVVVYTVTV